MLYEISPFLYFMWPLTFTSDLQLLSRSLLSLDVLYFMLLNVCTKNEVCKFSRIWNIDNWMEKTLVTSPWRHPIFDFYEILLQICKGHIKMAYQISDGSNKGELKYTEGKLTKNYEEKKNFDPLWPWPLTQGHQFEKGLSQCAKQPISKNRVQIGVSVQLEFCSQEKSRTHTHTHTHTHRDRQTHRQTAVKIWPLYDFVEV